MKFVDLREGLVASDSHHELTGYGRAGTSFAVVGSVWVVGLSLQTAGALDVVVSVLGPSAIAARAGLVALRDLLGGEQVGYPQGADGVRLDLLGGREGPARAAVTLVLYWGCQLA